MKKVLLQLDADEHPSVFDAVTALDAEVDVLLRHGNVRAESVQPLIHGLLFPRGPGDLHHSAVFIGGSSVTAGEAILDAAKAAFFGPFRVSVLFDPNGCNTTAAAATAKIAAAAGGIGGKHVAVLGGTGPVGCRAAALLAKEGAQVLLASRTFSRAEAAAQSLRERFAVAVRPVAATSSEETRRILEGVEVVLAAGAAGVTLLSESVWTALPELKVLADCNAVPPAGIEGIKPGWNGREREGKILFGALGIGELKMRVHKACLKRLFEAEDRIWDAEEIFAEAREHMTA
jgi:hypothetical protein